MRSWKPPRWILLLCCVFFCASVSAARLAPSETRPLESLAEPGLAELLFDLQSSRGIRPFDDRVIVVAGESAGTDVLVVQLERPSRRSDLLYLFYAGEADAFLFLEISVHPPEPTIVRLWGAGESEIVISRSGVRYRPVRSPGAIDLSPSVKAVAPADVVACLSGGLGATVDEQTIEDLMDGVSCGRFWWILLATNCLSAPHPVATEGCLLGFAKAMSCRLLRCPLVEEDTCDWPPGHRRYCEECGPCTHGEGDCDEDDECLEGLTCVDNVGRTYGFSRSTDVCEYPGDCEVALGDRLYCRDCGPCEVGEGDCDSDEECLSGLTCIQNVGRSYGFSASTDVCESTDS